MAQRFMETVLTPSVLEAQEKYYGQRAAVRPGAEPDRFTEEEQSFIEARDSFYMATVSETGWPYIQHRGGPPGFLRVLDPGTLIFPDYRGNRQMLSTGNLAAHDRVALFLMDYPRRERLKILGHARVEAAREHPEYLKRFVTDEERGHVERWFIIDVLSFDWNCPKYITPRFTAAELEPRLEALHRRIADLEAQLRAKSSSPPSTKL